MATELVHFLQNEALNQAYNTSGSYLLAELFVAPSETELLMLMRQILQTRIPQ